MIGDSFEARYRHTWLYRLADWVVDWLCAVLIGIPLGLVVYLGFLGLDTTPFWGLGVGVILLIGSYAVVYPIYRVVWRLVTRFGAASKVNVKARSVWRVCGVVAFVLAAVHPLYFRLSMPGRERMAMYDTRAIASAIRQYAVHCGGLPAHDPGTDCPVAGAEPGGPYVVPSNLYYWRQTNANGQIGGPFLPSWSWPTPPRHWFGVNDSYAYYILPGGRFVICARGEGTGANSQGGWRCPE